MFHIRKKKKVYSYENLILILHKTQTLLLICVAVTVYHIRTQGVHINEMKYSK